MGVIGRLDIDGVRVRGGIAGIDAEDAIDKLDIDRLDIDGVLVRFGIAGLGPVTEADIDGVLARLGSAGGTTLIGVVTDDTELLLLFLQSFLIVFTPLLTTVDRLVVIRVSAPLSESAENLLDLVSDSWFDTASIETLAGTVSQ